MSVPGLIKLTNKTKSGDNALQKTYNREAIDDLLYRSWDFTPLGGSTNAITKKIFIASYCDPDFGAGLFGVCEEPEELSYGDILWDKYDQCYSSAASPNKLYMIYQQSFARGGSGDTYINELRPFIEGDYDPENGIDGYVIDGLWYPRKPTVNRGGHPIVEFFQHPVTKEMISINLSTDYNSYPGESAISAVVHQAVGRYQYGDNVSPSRLPFNIKIDMSAGDTYCWWWDDPWDWLFDFKRLTDGVVVLRFGRVLTHRGNEVAPELFYSEGVQGSWAPVHGDWWMMPLD